MEKEYVRIQWENRPSIATPLGQSNLNKMDYQIDKNENTLITFDTTKANQSDLLQTIRTLTYDTETGIFVFTFWNGSTYSVDLNIEKIPVTFSMDEYGVITMTTADGTTYTCDIGALIKLYTFVDGDEIDFVTTTDAGGNKTITASIKDGSIVGSKLQPNFLADCQAAKAQAELAATNASSDASDAELSSEDSEAWAVGERNGQPVPSTDPAYENNAKWWAQHGTGSSFAGLTDTNFTNLQNGQIAKYNSTTQKWENTEDEGGLLPHFKITSEAGSTVTVVCPDTSVITPTQTSSGIWQCDVPAYGVYTVHAVINGDDAVRTVTVDTVKEYVIHDEHYSYTLNVYAPTGSSIIVTDGGDETYSGTGTGSTAVTFALHQASTTYTITVDYDLAEKIETITSSSTTGGSGSKTFEFGTINATVDNAFVGTDITCSLGGTVYTKTATTTSLTFHVPTTGTWVIAGEVSGTEFTVDANVVDLGTPVNVVLESIPEGTTVLPTDDIQTWLACANITNKSYTTLAEVLADTETYETLLADSNACQYMKRSTGLASATGLVPVMTDNTHPSGEASANIIYDSDHDAYKAFNVSETNGWIARTNTLYAVGDWLEYDFDTDITIGRVSVGWKNGSSANSGIKYKIQEYDGSSWVDVSTEHTISFIANTIVWEDVILTISSNRKHRLYITSGGANANGYGFKMQFYSDASIVDNQDAMARLGKFDYASNLLISDSTWCEAIANSDYIDYVMNTSVPKMTGNTTPSGTVLKSREVSSFEAYKAFDKNNSTVWIPIRSTTSIVGDFIGYAFTSPVCIKKVKIIGNRFANATIQASNDGTTYTPLKNIDLGGGDSDFSVDEILDNDVSYTHYMLKFTSVSTNVDCHISELQFYGRASSEVYAPLVPTMTSNTTPSGVAYATSELGDYLAWKAFNGLVGTVNDTNRWVSQMMAYGVDTYLSYDFGKQVSTSKIKIYAVRSGSVEHPLASVIHIEGSNDNTIWNSITTKSMTAVEMSQYTDINYDTVNYRYYRVYFESCNIQGSGNDYYSQVAYLQFYQKTVQTNIIHSAANDTIYMMENGSPVVLTTTNSDGDGILDFTQFMDGTYTLYSSVAKDPTNLSNDYSKSIRITKTSYGCTTEAYLMPDGALYWYGNTCDCLTGGLINAGHYPGHTANNIIFNSTSFTLSANGGNQDWGFQTANKISVTSAETIKMNIIANNNDMPLSWGLDSRYQPTSSSSPDIKSSSVNTVGVQSLSLSGITNGDYYVAGYNGQNGSYTRSMTIAFIIIV